jgi:glycosyltransferase involved in cell wall biosynthesis
VHPCTSWQSHQESKDPLRSKFVAAARAVDIPISHSKKYLDILKNEYGIGKTVQIIPGVDFELFKIRGTERPKNDKLVVGYVGRQYSSSSRKNPALLKKIGELPFVDLRITGGKVADKNIPEFYAGLDIVVSPATIEGGPMSIQEALAVGTPVMCFGDVGVAQEFNVGVIKVSKNDQNNTFLSRLEVLWKTKSYEQYRHAGIMHQMRNQVLSQTWKRFVLRHDMVWKSLV